MITNSVQPATLQSLTLHSNQLSNAAAKKYYYLLYKKTFFAKSIHNKKQSFISHLHEIVTVIEKSTQKISIMYFKITKSFSAAGGFGPRLLLFLYYSNTTLLKNTRRLSCMFLIEFTKLCDQLCISCSKTHPRCEC